MDEFGHLPPEEKRAFTAEVLRRSLPFDSGRFRTRKLTRLLAPSSRRLRASKTRGQEILCRAQDDTSRAAGGRFCYDLGMTAKTRALLDEFEHLPPEEKRAFTAEVLRRSLPFDSGPISDEEIGAASGAVFEALDGEDAQPKSR